MRERLQSALQVLAQPVWSGLAVALLSVVLAWQVGSLFWLLMPPSPHLVLGEGVVVRPPIVVDPMRVGKLFGEQAAPAGKGGLIDTTLSLKLEGVMVHSDAKRSLAFITERKPQALVLIYHVGDLLPGGARLDSIADQWVMLLRDGVKERLAFDKPGMPTQPAPGGPGAPPPPPGGAAATANALNQVAAQFANSPEAALREMGLRRTSQGYIVSTTAPKELMQRYGLNAGDRVVSVNGQALGKDIQTDQETMLQLQKTGTARVEVQRGDQTITLEQRL